MFDAAATPEAFLAMVERIAAPEPAHTHRSERQVAFDQFSTPLPLACATFLAADIQPGDTVLEPSAGTGGVAPRCVSAGRRRRHGLRGHPGAAPRAVKAEPSGRR